MKNRIILSSFVLLSSLTIISCISSKDYDLVDYKKEMEYKDNFKIMQLTDIHFSLPTNMDRQFKFLKKNIITSNPDLIAITGDSFFGATKRQVDLFFDFFDNLGYPYAFVNGNHDHQGSYDSYYVEAKLNNSKTAVFVDYQDDKLTGNMNYYIDLKKGDDIIYRLFMIDSGSYIYKDGMKYKYGVIEDDQIAHFKAIQEKSKDDEFTTLAFFHIPLYEYIDAYKDYQDGKTQGNGVYNEDPAVGYENRGQFNAFKEMGVKGIFVGHDHINCSNILYKDVILSYGLKSTDSIYHDDELIGYKELVLPQNGNFTLDNINDVKVGVK